VNLEADEVADDEEWRVFEGFVVFVELLVGGFEVFSFGFVFPGEPAALPYVREALLAGAGFGDALFKGVGRADLIDFGGVGDAKGLAEIAEVLRRGGTLGERAGVPFANEVQEIEGHLGLGYFDREKACPAATTVIRKEMRMSFVDGPRDDTAGTAAQEGARGGGCAARLKPCP